MKQATEPKMPALGPNLINNDPVTVKELIYQLTKASNGARMLAKKKKEFLQDVFLNKKDIIEQCKLFDSILGTSLNDATSSLIPINARVIKRDSSNTDLAKMVAKLLCPLKILRNHILAQYEEEKNSKSHNIRSSTNEMPQETPVLKLLNSSFELLEVLTEDGLAHRTPTTVHTAVKPVKLTSIQRQWKWSEDLVPVQRQLQFCPLCDHKSTNFAPENSEVVEFNKKKEDEFQKALKLWDSYIQKVTNGDRNAKKPHGLKRRPQRRNDWKEPIIICKCSVSFCLGEFEEQSNSCPIKCLKSNNDDSRDEVAGCKVGDKGTLPDRVSGNTDRYPFNKESTKKYCSCPICVCKCNFACTIADVPKMMLWRKLQDGKQNTKSNGYETSHGLFFQDIFKESAKICYSTIKEQTQVENLKKNSIKSCPIIIF